MSAALHPCEHCARHIRVSEIACHFCAAPVRRTLGPHSARGAILVVGAALALAGCDVSLVSTAHAEDDEPIRLTPQYGAPDYVPEPPPLPPPSSAPDGIDAGVNPNRPRH